MSSCTVRPGCVLTSLVFLCLIGCSAERSPVSQLDKESGVGPLILGDSLYADYMERFKSEADEDRVIERRLFGTAISAGQYTTNQNRFLFDRVAERIYVVALNGEISQYRANLGEVDSSSYASLIDSLRSRYGPPTSKRDTVISRLDTIRAQVHQHLWKAQTTGLTASYVSERRSLQMRVYDQGAVERMEQIRDRIDSLQKRGHSDLRNLESVGQIPLYTTKSEALDIRGVSEETIGSTRLTTISVDEEGLIRPFVAELDDPLMLYGSLYFTRGDSLSEVSISLGENANFDQVVSLLCRGSPQFPTQGQ